MTHSDPEDDGPDVYGWIFMVCLFLAVAACIWDLMTRTPPVTEKALPTAPATKEKP